MPSSSPSPISDSPPSTNSSSTTPPRTLRIGTRSSTLALAQVSLFTSLLSTSTSSIHFSGTDPSSSDNDPSNPQSTTPLSTIPTTTLALSTSLGDTNKTTSLHTLASTGKSLWTESLETELLSHTVDILIHSLKDVPTKLPLGCKVRAVGRREERGDVVLFSPSVKAKGITSLAELATQGVKREGGKEGRLARVGTSSVRRAAMLKRLHPGLEIVDCRGNVPTRIRKLEAPNGEGEGEGGFDAIILAAAGIARLGLSSKVSEWLSWDKGMGHAVGQGALGVEWREGDDWVERILEAVEEETGRRGRWEGEAERGLLRVLEGGCSVPVGVECAWDEGEGLAGGGKEEGGEEVKETEEGEGEEGIGERKGEGFLTLKAMVVSVDGSQCVLGQQRQWVSNDREAEECGIATARELVENGAGEILKEIELNRGMLRDMDNA